MVLLYVVDMLVVKAIKGAWPGDEEEDKIKAWTKFLAKETAFSVLGSVPFLRDVTGPLEGFDGGGAYGGITKDIAAPFIQIVQGDFDKPLVKSIINAGGLATGIPSLQINRFVDAWMRANEGEDVPWAEYLLGKRGKK